MTVEQEMYLTELNRRSRMLQYSNYQASLHYEKKNDRLNVITIILSTVVSSMLFVQVIQYLSSIKMSNSFYVTLGAGVLSVLVTVLSVLQMYFNYSELAEKSKRIAARYGEVRREVEALMAQKSIDNNEFNDRVSRINTTMTKLAEDSPTIPNNLSKKVKKYLSSDPVQSQLFLGKFENGDSDNMN